MSTTHWFARAVVRTVAVIAGLGGLFAVFLLGARPWYRHWGATDAEIAGRLPGDEIVPAATTRETRAITINAPVERVWPWLTQLGQDRGGFYSYQVLENLVGCEMPKVESLDPTLQSWRVGDKLWMYPPRKLKGAGFATLAAWVPGRAMGFATRQMGTSAAAPADGSWSFAVVPLGAGQSRLIVRGRASAEPSAAATAFSVLVFEPAHFAMERKTLASIKALAEGGRLNGSADVFQVVLWTLTFLLFVVAGVRLLVGRGSVLGWAIFVGAGLLFQFLSLVQPSPWLGLFPLLWLTVSLAVSRGRWAKVGLAHLRDKVAT